MGDIWDQFRPIYGVGEDGGPVTSFQGQTPDLPDSQSNPIAVMIAVVLQILSWEDPSVRPMAEYFRLAGILGASSGRQQHWPLDVAYTSAVADRLKKGEAVAGYEWSEWQLNLP